MTDSAARPPDYPDKCELCGTPVRVVGSVTKSYESAFTEALKLADEVMNDLELTLSYYWERIETSLEQDQFVERTMKPYRQRRKALEGK